MLYFVVLAHTTHAQSSAFTYQGRLNADNRIATVDADGVALAAIQGLNQKLDETRAENAELKMNFPTSNDCSQNYPRKETEP